MNPNFDGAAAKSDHGVFVNSGALLDSESRDLLEEEMARLKQQQSDFPSAEQRLVESFGKGL